MPLTLTQIEHEVEALPMEDKFQLLEHLHLQLEPEQQELDRIWAEEANARFESIMNGTSKTIPAEQVFAELRAKFASKR
jgi:putative addiction module component (TIGR02574 family)